LYRVISGSFKTNPQDNWDDKTNSNSNGSQIQKPQLIASKQSNLMAQR